jgi:hypothetical protein
MTDIGLILGEPSSHLLFTIFFSLTLPFSLLFPLEDSIKEYYHHTEEETKDVEPYATVFTPRGGFIWSVLLGMGTEGAGGGVYRRVWVLGCGVAVME